MARLTTSNGRDYAFTFERQLDGSIRPYITEQPAYGSRSDGLAETHREQDEEGRFFVAWDEPLYTVEDAKEVAGEFSKRTDVYIDTGVWKPYKKAALPATTQENEIPEGTVF